MERIKGFMTVALFAFVLSAAPQALGFTATYAPDREAIPIVLPEGKILTLAQVRDAIARGAKNKGWVVDADGPGKLRLRHTDGKREVVLDLPYDEKTYSIKYVSSLNMKIRENNRGERKAHPSYTRWINNLERAIDAELSGGSAKEVAEMKEEPADSEE